ncbi:putative inorganic phosphate cotransporter [Halotydeus destructor]|nr:putative inorganic phosphate cotransporter [Halotydeus destructor]
MAFGVRYLILFLIMLAAMIDYVARLNINVTIVSMVKPLNRSIKSYQVCFVSEEEAEQTFSNMASPASRYDFTLSQQSAILGAFFYTYTVLQIPFGSISHAYGGKWVICLGLLGTSIINFLTPLLSGNYYTFLATRLAMGVCQAGMFPAGFGILYFWFPKREQSFAFALLSCGAIFGSILASSLSGYLCDYGFAGGWPSVFYVSGILAMIVFIVTSILLTSKPRGHWLISETELRLINQDKVPEAKNQPPVPWKAILSSAPFWAISIAYFAQGFGYYMASAELPTYMSQILRVDSTMQAVVVLFMLFGMFKGLDTGAFMPIVAEMSQEYASVVFAIVNTVASNASYAATAVAGLLLGSGGELLHRWNLLFYVTAVVLIIGLLSVNLMDARRQSWDIAETLNTENEAKT